jgi:hypothetical protein
MIITNTNGDTFTLRRHKKLPSFAETGTKRPIMLDGKKAAFILHPTKPIETQTRVSLIINGIRYHRDDNSFVQLVAKMKGSPKFTTVAKAAKATTAPKAAPKAPAVETKGKGKGAAKAAPKATQPPVAASVEAAPCAKCGKQPGIYQGKGGKAVCGSCNN